MKIIFAAVFILLCLDGIGQNKKPTIHGQGTIICISQQRCMNFTARDANDDTVTIWWDSALVQSTFTANNNSVKQPSAQVCITPQRGVHAPNVPHYFTIYATDGKDTVSRQFSVIVRDAPYKGHPVITKLSHNTFKIDVFGDTSEPWKSFPGLDHEIVIRDTAGKIVEIGKNAVDTFIFNSYQPFRVYVTYQTAICLYATVDTIVAGVSVSVNKISTLLSIYPNPANDFITVGFDNDFIGEASISDINGKLFISSVIAGMRQDINIQHLVPGIYFLLLKNNEGEISAVQKLIKE